MAFIAAKCPECGGAIQLDDSRESGYCMYCGTKVFLKESIAQRVQVDGIQTLEQKLNNANTYIKLGEVEKATALLTQITEEFTSDYRAWWMLAIIKSKAYRFFTSNIYTETIDLIGGSKEYKYAYQLASDIEKKQIEFEYGRFRKQIEKNRVSLAEEEQKRRLAEQKMQEEARVKNEERLKREAELEAERNKTETRAAKIKLLIISVIITVLVILSYLVSKF